MTDDSVCYWRCPNCGQIHFGDAPPDMCAYCRDFTTWQLIANDSPESDSSVEEPEQPQPDKHKPKQKRLFD